MPNASTFFYRQVVSSLSKMLESNIVMELLVTEPRVTSKKIKEGKLYTDRWLADIQ